MTLARKLSARDVRLVLSNLRWYFIYLILFKPKCEVQEWNSFWFTLSYTRPRHSTTVTNVLLSRIAAAGRGTENEAKIHFVATASPKN